MREKRGEREGCLLHQALLLSFQPHVFGQRAIASLSPCSTPLAGHWPENGSPGERERGAAGVRAVRGSLTAAAIGTHYDHCHAFHCLPSWMERAMQCRQ